mmetsp:Transcript_33940/g.85448  ORF Transcript_33940/g.85448 Transcript_33940/m.85448 type:complete len:234 (+) Transcript_33940:878-1579(+)
MSAGGAGRRRRRCRHEPPPLRCAPRHMASGGRRRQVARPQAQASRQHGRFLPGCAGLGRLGHRQVWRCTCRAMRFLLRRAVCAGGSARLEPRQGVRRRGHRRLGARRGALRASAARHAWRDARALAERHPRPAPPRHPRRQRRGRDPHLHVPEHIRRGWADAGAHSKQYAPDGPRTRRGVPPPAEVGAAHAAAGGGAPQGGLPRRAGGTAGGAALGERHIGTATGQLRIQTAT